jgi:hypothetical protein
MKIRDLSFYIKKKANQDIVYDSNLELCTVKDVFLTKLYGESNSAEDFKKVELTTLSSFAEDSDEQVFYEFLQNAKDAKGTGLWVFMDKKLGVLILNDGEPFHTNPSILNGSLFSFLGKKKTEKHKDSTNSGAKGMGSKLLYNLLVPYTSSGNLSGMSDMLADILSHELIAPILFSWSKKDINALRKILEVKNLSDFNIEDSESPIFCKLFLSYFPALPNQSLNYLGKEVIPFGKFEFDQFKKCLSEALKVFSSDELFYSPGSILYIPAPESTIQKLEDSFEKISGGLAQSLSVLSIDETSNKIKRIHFGESKIEKKEFQSIPITVQLDDSELSASIVFSLTRDDKQKTLPSIFTDYFPVSKEIHGLGYILRCKKFNILDNRQKLRKNETDKFIAFANELIESWSQIPGSYYSSFLGSLAISNDPEEGEEILQFHQIVKGYAKHQIQTSQIDIPRAKATEVIALPSGFEEINISELFSGKYPLHGSLYEYYIDGLDNWGVECYSLSRLFHEAGVEKTRKFIETSDEYLEIVKQLELEDETDYLYEIPFIPTAKGYLSIKEFCENPHAFLLFPQNQFGSFRKQCEKEKVQIWFSLGVNEFLELSYFPNIKSLIESNWDNYKIFERVSEFFERGEIVLSQDLRNQIFSVLNSYDKEMFSGWIKDEAPYFSNRKGDSGLSIGEIIGGSPSIDFFKDWKLPLKEEFSVLKPFQAEKEAIWGIISSDRSYLSNKIRELGSSELIKPVLSELLGSFQNRSDKKNEDVFFGSKDKLAFTQDDKWDDFEKTIFHKGFQGLTESEYQSARELFSKLEYSVPNFDLLTIYGSKEFQRLFQIKSLGSLNMGWTSVSIEEVKILKKMTDAEDVVFLKIFSLKGKSFKSFQIKSNTDSSCQFFYAPSEVSLYLNQEEGYFELPDPLKSIFGIKDGLYDVNTEIFKNKLLEDFGSQRSFLGLFQKASDELKIAYIENLDTVEIKSDDGNVLDERSFEVNLVKAFADNETLLSKVKEKIQIDGKSISHDGYNATVTINSHSYTLSELLDDQEGAMDRISKATNLFSTLNPRLREKLLGLEDKPLSDIKDEILVADKGKPVHAAFLIDYLEQEKEDSEFALDDLPDFLEIDVYDLFDEFRSRKVEWKKHWGSSWFGFDPEIQIIPIRDELWKEAELIPEDLLRWVNNSDEKLQFLSNDLSNQSQVKNSEQFRSSLQLGKVLEKIYLYENMRARSFDWVIDKKTIFNENEGKRLWEIVDKQGLWDKYLIPYTQWGEVDERAVRLTNDLSSIKYYFESTSHFEFLKMSELSPETVIILNGGIGSNRKEIAKKHRLIKLKIGIRPEGDLPDREEWEVGYYQQWKDNKEVNHFTYRIFKVSEMIKSSAIIFKAGEPFIEINSAKDQSSLRIEVNGRHRELFVRLEEAEKLTLTYLGEIQSDLFVGESETQDLVRLFSLANEFQDKAFSDLRSKGIIDENYNPISSQNEKSTSGESSGNVYLDGYENLKDPQLLLNNWELIKALMDKFGKDFGKKLQEALENETDDSKPNKLSGFIGEQLAREWFEKKYEKDATWLGDRYLAYDISLGKNDLIEIKTKINTLYDESVGDSSTTAVYLRKSQLNFVEDTSDKQYYLGLISLEDLGILENYHEWLKIWGREKEIQESLQETIRDFAKNFISDEEKMNLFADHFRLIFMKNGKEQFSAIN